MTGPKFAQRAAATWWAIQMLHASLQLQRRLAWEVFKCLVRAIWTQEGDRVKGER